MSNLLIHCGGYAADRNEIAHVTTPPPEDRWYPTPHIELIDQVQNSITNLGYEIKDEAFALAKNGARLFGMFKIPGGHPDGDMIVGLRNSHDKSFAINIALGFNVFVCDNLSFHGEYMVNRKHTRFSERDLPRLVDSAVGHVVALNRSMEERISNYKEAELTNMLLDHLIMELYRTQVVPSSQIGKVLKEYEAPSHPEFSADGHTFWRLYNAVTEILKQSSIMQLPKRSITLHAVLDAASETFVTQ